MSAACMNIVYALAGGATGAIVGVVIGRISRRAIEETPETGGDDG